MTRAESGSILLTYEGKDLQDGRRKRNLRFTAFLEASLKRLGMLFAFDDAQISPLVPDGCSNRKQRVLFAFLEDSRKGQTQTNSPAPQKPDEPDKSAFGQFRSIK